MSSINKIILIGNLGADPDTRFTRSGKATTELRLATSRKWKGTDGNLEEATEWHRVVLWDKQAEFAGKYLTKGAKVYVEGRIQTRTYEKDGETKYITEIVAHEIQSLSPKGAGGGGGDDAEAEAQRSPNAQNARRFRNEAKTAKTDDDLPF